ncbi:MAG: TolC family protein [Planctomycetota bacterium]|jgi:outer membrane protein TolC
MRMGTKFFILILVTANFTALSSILADDVNELKTLEDYLRYAALNNAELKGQFEGWKSAVEQVPQAKALDDPKFTYGYFIEEVETRVGPQKNRFGIMQVFPWFGTIEARTDAASSKAKAAQKGYDATKLKLFREVKEGFYEYAYLSTAIGIAKENLELLLRFEEVTRTKYRAAAATHPDIVRVQIELAQLEDVVKSLEELQGPTVASLNAALNRPSGAELGWPEREALQILDINREQIIDILIKNNPDLAGLNWHVEAARSEVELAKKKFYPDIGVGVDWIQTDDAISPGVRDSGKDPIVLMFSMNIPLWGESYKAGERQAQANVRKAQQAKVNAENQAVAKALGVVYDIKDSERKMQLYGNILVPKAQELVLASEAAYKAGTVDFLSLIDAQRMLLKYNLDHERAKTNYQQKAAELEALVGVELDY